MISKVKTRKEEEQSNLTKHQYIPISRNQII